MELKLVKINLLLPHEEISEERLEVLLEKIKKGNFIESPIVADASSLVILDGHHRFEAIKKLKRKTIPAYLVDYKSRAIKVFSRRKNYKVSKKEILKRGISGKLYPYKTTRHAIAGLDKWKVPLDIL